MKTRLFGDEADYSSPSRPRLSAERFRSAAEDEVVHGSLFTPVSSIYVCFHKDKLSLKTPDDIHALLVKCSAGCCYLKWKQEHVLCRAWCEQEAAVWTLSSSRDQRSLRDMPASSSTITPGPWQPPRKPTLWHPPQSTLLSWQLRQYSASPPPSFDAPHSQSFVAAPASSFAASPSPIEEPPKKSKCGRPRGSKDSPHITRRGHPSPARGTSKYTNISKPPDVSQILWESYEFRRRQSLWKGHQINKVNAGMHEGCVGDAHSRA